MKAQFKLINYVERAGDSTYFLALLYLAVLAFSARWLWLARRRTSGQWEPRTLFIASVLFASIIRFLSYTTLAFLSFRNIQLATVEGAADDDPALGSSSHRQFYTRVMEVLFNVGDFVFLTAYLMLVVVWVETFQYTRRHFFSPSSLKRKWLVFYLVLTIFLYFMLILLYSLFLFSTENSPQLLDAIYVTLALVDLLVPLALVASWCCLAMMYSGFPFRSDASRKRWTNMNRLLGLWSCGRIVWGISSLIAMYFNWASHATAWQFGLGLVTLAVVAEILPFMLAPTTLPEPHNMDTGLLARGDSGDAGRALAPVGVGRDPGHIQ